MIAAASSAERIVRAMAQTPLLLSSSPEPNSSKTSVPKLCSENEDAVL